MAYVIHFFTSEETNEVGCGLKSSKLSTSQLSDFELVRVLKTFVGNEDLPDSTYVLPIIEQWKKPFLATMQKWAVLFPKLNEVISLVSKLEEGRYLGISFNEPIENRSGDGSLIYVVYGQQEAAASERDYHLEEQV